MDIVIVSDEPIFRTGVKSLLGATAGMALVGEAASARAAFRLIDERRTSPNVALVDLMLPGLDGFAATRELRRRCAQAKVVALSSRREAREVVEAFSAGAGGYFLKSDQQECLLEAIRAVFRGIRYISPSVDPMTRGLVERNARGAGVDVLAVLSVREREVFTLLVRGLSNEAVAKELCIARKTLDTHRHRIYDKLGCHSMVDLVRFASANGLLLHAPRALARGPELAAAFDSV